MRKKSIEKQDAFLYHKYIKRILTNPAIPIPNNGSSNNSFDICNTFSSNNPLL